MDKNIPKNTQKYAYSGGFRKRRNREARELIKVHPIPSKCARTRIGELVVHHESGAPLPAIPPQEASVSVEENIIHEEANAEETNIENLAFIDEFSGESAEFDIDLFKQDLVQWCLGSKVNHEQLKGLLSIWNKHVPLSPLPSDPRTLLKTPRNVETFEANYWHYGLKKQLLDILSRMPASTLPESISLRLHLDGIPLSKSSSVDCWPVLFDVFEMKYLSPRVVGVFCGRCK